MAGVLVDAMQADEGIEHEQPWLQPGDGVVESTAVSVEIKAQGCGGDHRTSRSAMNRAEAAQMPSSRRRTMCGASSAAYSRTRPGCLGGSTLC